MPTYKLKYFHARARAELARLMFAYQGQEYEDVRYTFDQWAEEKPNTPFGQIPVLEIDGRAYGESVAINNHLAREFGLYGKDGQQKLEIDQVVGITQDVWRSIVDWKHEKDPVRQAQLLKDNEEKHFPRYLGYFEKILKENGTGFYVGNEMTYADIAAFDAIDVQVADSLLEKFPLVAAIKEKVRTHDKLKDYIATRKETMV